MTLVGSYLGQIASGKGTRPKQKAPKQQPVKIFKSHKVTGSIPCVQGKNVLREIKLLFGNIFICAEFKPRFMKHRVFTHPFSNNQPPLGSPPFKKSLIPLPNVYLCMYVCMYVYIFIYIYTYIYIIYTYYLFFYYSIQSAQSP